MISGVMRMKVLALLSQDMFRLSIGWVLEELGNKLYYVNQIREDILEQAIQTFQPDVIFDVGWDAHFRMAKLPVLANVLKKHHLYHVYFAEEDWLHYERWSEPYTQQVVPQFVLTRSQACAQRYQARGIQAAYLDVGCNPRFHRSMAPSLDYDSDVSVVANAQLRWEIFRRESISNLVLPLFDAPLKVKIWGKGWDEVLTHLGKANPGTQVWQGTLPFLKTPLVYNSTRINVSIQSVEDQLSNRTYDILASGGFLFTSDTPAVRERLQPGIHCEISNSPEETMEKIQFYLSNESAREKIARAGQEYAINHFSYQNTLPDVWQLVEQDVVRYSSSQ